MEEEKRDFHFGLCITTVVDVRVQAKTEAEAVRLFAEMQADRDKMKGASKAVLDRHIEMLGMIEGELPTPPSAMDVHEGGEAVH